MSVRIGPSQGVRRSPTCGRNSQTVSRAGPVTLRRGRRHASVKRVLHSTQNGASVVTDLKRFPQFVPPDFDDEETESDTEPVAARRVLLKISGEALQGPRGCGIDPEVLGSVASEIEDSWKEGHQIAIVIGGGNFFRGADAFDGIDRATADYVGMLATTMNAVCLQSVLENLGVQTRLQTAIEIREVAEPYIRRRAIRHLEKERVVIFGAGTGNPFFTTDMAAALRAAEIGAQEVLKATKVEGVYSSDPHEDPSAKLLDHVTYDEALIDGLHIMDHSAVSLCREHSIPIRVFSLQVPGNISKAIRGESVGSVMRHREETVKQQPDPRSQLKQLETDTSVTHVQ